MFAESLRTLFNEFNANRILVDVGMLNADSLEYSLQSFRRCSLSS